MNVFGLNVDSMQADKQILDALKQFGASMDIQKEHIMVQKRKQKQLNLMQQTVRTFFLHWLFCAASPMGFPKFMALNDCTIKKVIDAKH